MGQNCRGCGPLTRMKFLVKARPVCATAFQHSSKTVYCYHYDMQNPYPDTQLALGDRVVRIGTGTCVHRS